MSRLADRIRVAVQEALRAELPRLLADLARPAANDGERLLSVDEAAQRLGLSDSTVYKRAQACELASVKVGTRLLFKVSDLDAYTQARRRSPERVKALAKAGTES